MTKFYQNTRLEDIPGWVEFREGASAYKDGRSLDDNPYRENSIRRLFWTRGWYEHSNQLEEKNKIIQKIKDVLGNLTITKEKSCQF